MQTAMNLLKTNDKHSELWMTFDKVEKKQWDYSLPTFVPTLERDWLMNPDTIVKRFYDNNPYLKDVNMTNVLIAGGSVSATIIGSDYDDVDLFIYGLDDAKRDLKLRYLIKAISAAMYAREINISHISGFIEMNSEDQFDRVYTIRNQNCVTIKNSYRKVQIILRKYNTAPEVIQGFDLGSSAIGINGNKVILTPLAKFAYEYGLNIIDTDRRSTTYEARLAKYFQRGFGIVMPYFQGEVRPKKPITIHNLRIVPQTVAGMKYASYVFYDTSVDSDYQIDLDYQGAKNLNIRLLRSGEQDPIKYYYMAKGLSCVDILSSTGFICASDIISYYREYAKKIYKNGVFNAEMCEKIFGLSPLLAFAKIINNPGSMDSIADEKAKELIDLMNKITPAPLAWREGGSQVSGSFNPIIADPADWYGEYYKQPTN
ncbi:hypothetical protein BNJ_00065 [Kaumoebavirus]|uniref:hypothetical protein n=1 Tax=Kaumoebavirus TaxID=1859492 RepID=UPI0009C36E5F|nr:hypothetical protein BNJ_00065 [Kaumoebavirus]ARA71907.1 hypothetical protein BNJ_00065 [Kaumoebavirus]